MPPLSSLSLPIQKPGQSSAAGRQERNLIFVVLAIRLRRSRGARRFGREEKREGRSAPSFLNTAADPNRSSMVAHDLLDNREADAGAPLAFRGESRIKDSV